MNVFTRRVVSFLLMTLLVFNLAAVGFAAAEPETVTVEEEEVPLAGAEKNTFPWWIILVIIAVTAVGGYIVYDRKKKA